MEESLAICKEGSAIRNLVSVVFSRLPSWRAASYRCARFSRGDCFWHYFLTKHAWLLFAARRLSIEKFPQVFANRADWSGGNIPWFHGHWSQPHFPASHYAGGRRLSFVLKFKANFRQLGYFQYCARNFSSRRTQLTWQWWTPGVVKWSELKCPHNRRACLRLAHLEPFRRPLGTVRSWYKRDRNWVTSFPRVIHHFVFFALFTLEPSTCVHWARYSLCSADGNWIWNLFTTRSQFRNRRGSFHFLWPNRSENDRKNSYKFQIDHRWHTIGH